MNNNSLAHTKWNYKYHVVFASKYRRNVFYGEKRAEIREILMALCQCKGDRNYRRRNISRPHTSTFEYTPKNECIRIYRIFEGKSSQLIFQKFGNMKFAYRNRESWCKGYYVDTIGKNTAAINSYIKNQIKVDKESDKLSIYDPRDPFTGSK